MPSKIKSRTIKHISPAIKKLKKKGYITEYILPSNGLRILHVYKPGTGVVTSDITYKVGSRDEELGETGVAHMLEHMLFKPTAHDLKRKTDSAAMLFEREVGCNLNATTWKDRTTYFFSYPKEHFDRALKIEAERMCGVVLSDKEFLPERTNVLSEYDMNAGSEEFSLSVPMIGTALQSHPYGHETIGYREDIEGYTTAMLDVFYKKYYAPNNATLIIAGDVDEASMCASVVAHFASIKPSKTLTSRKIIKEPKQTGMRTVLVKKPSTTNVLGIGVRHDGFPSKGWIETSVLFSILVGGTDSILHKKLVDTAEAISVEGGLEPTYDANIGIIYITLAPGVSHEVMYLHVREILDAITIHDVSPYLKKIIAQNITSECTNRESSYGLVMELIEYVSADAWERFFDTEKLLHSITAKDIIARIKQIYAEDVITIGKYIGTK